MTNPTKHIVFDVVGTLVSYEHLSTAIAQRLGDKLEMHNISPRLLSFAWLESAEREYTYLSISGNYVEFAKVFKSIFFRVLHFAGVPEPRSIATEEDVQYFVAEYRNCEARPGAKQCIDKLRAAGWTVWAFTSGDRARIRGYFDKGGLKIEEANLVTCDDIGTGKPEPKAYEGLKQKIRAGSEVKGDLWFAAAHGWDVSAARGAGFKTAYCTVLEKEPLQELFGEMDVVVGTLPDLAERIVTLGY